MNRNNHGKHGSKIGKSELWVDIYKDDEIYGYFSKGCSFERPKQIK